MRVAGGWVRDKLLGLESDDIDIALDDISGETFAKMVAAELYPGSDKQKYGVTGKDVEQSKHLEVACMKVHGQSIDLVGLRAEDYTEES